MYDGKLFLDKMQQVKTKGLQKPTQKAQEISTNLAESKYFMQLYIMPRSDSEMQSKLYTWPCGESSICSRASINWFNWARAAKQ